jgi:hypothetical protein
VFEPTAPLDLATRRSEKKKKNPKTLEEKFPALGAG